MLQTALYNCHINAGATMVNFGNWSMPLHYGSQIEEHHTVRNNVGIFDVSHMAIIDITGSDASAALRYILANNESKKDTWSDLKEIRKKLSITITCLAPLSNKLSTR